MFHEIKWFTNLTGLYCNSECAGILYIHKFVFNSICFLVWNHSFPLFPSPFLFHFFFFSISILSLLYLGTTAGTQDLTLEKPSATELYSRRMFSLVLREEALLHTEQTLLQCFPGPPLPSMFVERATFRQGEAFLCTCSTITKVPYLIIIAIIFHHFHFEFIFFNLKYLIKLKLMFNLVLN